MAKHHFVKNMNTPARAPMRGDGDAAQEPTSDTKTVAHSIEVPAFWGESASSVEDKIRGWLKEDQGDDDDEEKKKEWNKTVDKDLLIAVTVPASVTLSQLIYLFVSQGQAATDFRRGGTSTHEDYASLSVFTSNQVRQLANAWKKWSRNDLDLSNIHKLKNLSKKPIVATSQFVELVQDIVDSDLQNHSGEENPQLENAIRQSENLMTGLQAAFRV